MLNDNSTIRQGVYIDFLPFYEQDIVLFTLTSSLNHQYKVSKLCVRPQ